MQTCGAPIASQTTSMPGAAHVSKKELRFQRAASGASQSKFPRGWDEARVRGLLAHYESQTDEEAVGEDEAAVEGGTDTVMTVPKPLVPAVRELIAKAPTRRRRKSAVAAFDIRHAASLRSNPNVIAVHSPHCAPRNEGRPRHSRLRPFVAEGSLLRDFDEVTALNPRTPAWLAVASLES